jgi:hypothetical protein
MLVYKDLQLEVVGGFGVLDTGDEVRKPETAADIQTGCIVHTVQPRCRLDANRDTIIASVEKPSTKTSQGRRCLPAGTPPCQQYPCCRVPHTSAVHKETTMADQPPVKYVTQGLATHAEMQAAGICCPKHRRT